MVSGTCSLALGAVLFVVLGRTVPQRAGRLRIALPAALLAMAFSWLVPPAAAVARGGTLLPAWSAWLLPVAALVILPSFWRAALGRILPTHPDDSEDSEQTVPDDSGRTVPADAVSFAELASPSDRAVSNSEEDNLLLQIARSRADAAARTPDAPPRASRPQPAEAQVVEEDFEVGDAMEVEYNVQTLESEPFAGDEAGAMMKPDIAPESGSTPEPVAASAPFDEPEPSAASAPYATPEPAAAAAPYATPEPATAAALFTTTEPVAVAKPAAAPEPAGALETVAAPETPFAPEPRSTPAPAPNAAHARLQMVPANSPAGMPMSVLLDRALAARAANDPQQTVSWFLAALSRNPDPVLRADIVLDLCAVLKNCGYRREALAVLAVERAAGTDPAWCGRIRAELMRGGLA